ncbi:unnamed protein product, partial [Dovyalis caffra]
RGTLVTTPTLKQETSESRRGKDDAKAAAFISSSEIMKCGWLANVMGAKISKDCRLISSYHGKTLEEQTLPQRRTFGFLTKCK